ncbi:CopD family protein [Nocardioides zeae]
MPGRSTGIAVAVVLLAPLVGVGAALAALGVIGGLAAVEVVGLPDPGALTRLGLPAVQALRDLLAMATVGVLVVAAWCVPRRGRDERSPAQDRLALAGQLSATGWAVANAVLVVLVYSDVLGQPPGGAGATSQLFYFAFNLEAGRNLTWGAVLAVGVAVVCAVGRRPGGVGVAAGLAIVALWPMALSGHAAGTLAHDHAVNLQMLHLVGTAVWAGGLAGLVLVRAQLGPGALTTSVCHFSVLAVASLVAVAVSGVVGAALRVRRVEGLDSAYGAVLGLKVVALLLLAGLGWWQRRRLVDRIGAAPHVFSRIAALEVVVLATAAGWGWRWPARLHHHRRARPGR